jgi:hypothetical protein
MQAKSSCHEAEVIYNFPVRLNGNLFRAALLTALALDCAGCGGISASKSVSPATFLLPGILRNDSPVCTNSVASLIQDTPIDTTTGAVTNPDSVQFTTVVK